MDITHIKTSDCVLNTGQLEGLPQNPRQWTKDEVDNLAKSLTETPELFEARPLLVYPHEGKYIVLGGNMRLTAAKQNKAKEVPAIVFQEDTPTEKLREIVVKDNGSFGSWDYDALANEWDDLPLTEWGVPAWDTDSSVSPDDFGTEFSLPDGDKSPFQQMTFVLADTQAEGIKKALGEAKSLTDYQFIETFGNNNTNGNALYLVVKQWEDARK